MEKKRKSPLFNTKEGPFQIGIDLMGSDFSPLDLMHLLFSTIDQIPSSVHLTLLATPEVFASIHSPSPRIALQTTPSFISAEDSPLSSIKEKKDSSMCIGIDLVKKKHFDAFLSGGNTGAFMASAKLSLPMLEGIDRPGLLTLLPTERNQIAVIDVGANTSSKALHLVQFAQMGVAFQKCERIPLPKVGLLNIGSEAKKGTPELREAYQRLSELSASEFDFRGNIEARDVFRGGIDVLVTDGFTGNIFLKTAEGVSSFILDQLTKITPQEILSQMPHRLNYAQYPGALLCGSDGVLIKCHGNTFAQSLPSTIHNAYHLVKNAFIDQVKMTLAKSFSLPLHKKRGISTEQKPHS